MKNGELCMRDVVVTTGDSGLTEIANLMREYHVGDIVVVRDKDNAREPIGIVTDRDIVLEVFAKEVPAETCSVADIMSDDLVTVTEDGEVWQTLELMRNKGVRRVPVVDNNQRLIGIISADDVVDFLAEEMKNLVSLFRHQPLKEQQRRP